MEPSSFATLGSPARPLNYRNLHSFPLWMQGELANRRRITFFMSRG